MHHNVEKGSQERAGKRKDIQTNVVLERSLRPKALKSEMKRHGDGVVLTKALNSKHINGLLLRA